MATYKSSAGAILQPGNQINKLSGYNDEGVFGWPGIEAFELIGFAKVTNLSATKASFKSFDLTVPSPDRRPDCLQWQHPRARASEAEPVRQQEGSRLQPVWP